MGETPQKLLTDEEAEILMLGAIDAAGEKGLSSVEGDCILAWAQDAALKGNLLQLALKGKIRLGWKDDDIVVRMLKGTEQ